MLNNKIMKLCSAFRWLIILIHMLLAPFNTLTPRQNWRHFADDIFKRIYLNKYIWIPIKISLKVISRGSINNIPSLVQIMAWRRPGDKPLSEPMMVSSLTHICVTRPQWVNRTQNCQFARWHITIELQGRQRFARCFIFTYKNRYN